MRSTDCSHCQHVVDVNRGAKGRDFFFFVFLLSGHPTGMGGNFGWVGVQPPPPFTSIYQNRPLIPLHLYQSSEEAKKEEEYRKKFYCRSPHAHRKKKHPPHAKSQDYRLFRTTSTRTSSQEKPSPDVLSAPT